MQEWQLQKWNKHPVQNDLSRFHGKSGMGIVLQRTCPKEKTEGGLPWWLSGKASACNAGDPGSIPHQEDPLEKGMATHSSILAWRLPWTEAPGGEQSMGL